MSAEERAEALSPDRWAEFLVEFASDRRDFIADHISTVEDLKAAVAACNRILNRHREQDHHEPVPETGPIQAMRAEFIKRLNEVEPADGR